MTKQEISQQVTALWQRVGKTEMAVPSYIGSSPLPLDEEVYVLCERLVSQAYEEAALKCEALAQQAGAAAPGRVDEMAYRREALAATGLATQIRTLKDQLKPAAVSSR